LTLVLWSLSSFFSLVSKVSVITRDDATRLDKLLVLSLDQRIICCNVYLKLVVLVIFAWGSARHSVWSGYEVVINEHFNIL